VSVKEEMLVLCQAYPAISERYEILICMAGITSSGDFRRIYPIPFRTWQGNPISKRCWIRYTLRENKSSDGRKESRKIDPSSIEIFGMEDKLSVRNILEKKCTTIEDLTNQEASLGIVRPILKRFKVEDDLDREIKARKIREQQTLDGGSIDFYFPSVRLGYEFRCKTPEPCKGHDIMCEDWEAYELYRKLEQTYKERTIVDVKARDKLYDWMLKERDLYFMMGTHFRFGTWLIISLLYPDKRMVSRLDIFDE
jgi:hypothetical protein